MHKIISITPKALEDLQQAIDYYNEQLQGLGIRFEGNVNDTFGKIQKMPKAASFAYDTVRNKIVEDFPFIITYEELEKASQYYASSTRIRMMRKSLKNDIKTGCS